MLNILNRSIVEKRKRALFAFLSTFILGIIAHGMAMFNVSPIHDVLWEHENAFQHKASLGRFLEPLFRQFMGENIVLTYFTVLVGILFICISICLLCDMFNIERPVNIILLSGIFVTNITVLCLIASFTHDFSGDMCALFLSILAVHFLEKGQSNNKKRMYLLSIICLVLSLGLYQAYFAVSVVLVFILSLQKLINRKLDGDIIKKLSFSLLILFIGAVLYAVVTYFVGTLFDLSVYAEEGYNSLSNLKDPLDIFKKIPYGIFAVIRVLFLPNSSYAVKSVTKLGGYVIMAINIFLFLYSVIRICIKLKTEKRKYYEWLFMGVLLVLLPLAMSCVCILTGIAYSTLVFPCWLFYLIVMVVCKNCKSKENNKRNIAQYCVSFLIAIVIFSNIQMSNMSYEKKEFDKYATLSTMTRVVSTIENADGYEYGKTPVAIIGNYYDRYEGVPGTEEIQNLDGMQFNSTLSYAKTIYNYFAVYLQYDINLCDGNTLTRLRNDPFVKDMPIFPDGESIRYVGEILVVKIGEIE